MPVLTSTGILAAVYGREQDVCLTLVALFFDIPTGLNYSSCQLSVFRPLIGRERQAGTAMIELNEGFGYKRGKYLCAFDLIFFPHLLKPIFALYLKAILLGKKINMIDRKTGKSKSPSSPVEAGL